MRNSSAPGTLTSLEVCAGAGGQALGLEQAGFEHAALVELDPHACTTLRANRPRWKVEESDLRFFDASPYRGVDLLAGGVPCPPFSIAGKQLGGEDERDLFPAILAAAKTARPKAIMIENVRGLLGTQFDEYRDGIRDQLQELGYRVVFWDLLQASDFGVPQLRPRSVLVALRPKYARNFVGPQMSARRARTVGEALLPLMKSRGWRGAEEWATRANRIAPTLVGGSHKHGGPDLGPTRAKRQWAELGVDARTLAESAPDPDFEGMPRLTVEMCAVLQGFPQSWRIQGRKTQAYRQVGNAFPPPVARAVGRAISAALSASD